MIVASSIKNESQILLKMVVGLASITKYKLGVAFMSCLLITIVIITSIRIKNEPKPDIKSEGI